MLSAKLRSCLAAKQTLMRGSRENLLSLRGLSLQGSGRSLSLSRLQAPAISTTASAYSWASHRCTPLPARDSFTSHLPFAVGYHRVFHTTSLLGEGTVVSTPPFAESVTEGDVRWEKGVGDFVQEDELLAEIETDKTAIPVPSPVSGVIEEILVPDGETVQAGAQLCRIKVTGEAPSSSTTTATAATASTTTSETSAGEPQAPPPPVVPPPPEADTPPASIPIPTEPPSPPPLPGQPFAQVSPPPPSPPRPPPPTSSQAPPTSQAAPGTRSETRVKMSRMRQRIAERLKEAQNVNAMLTTFNEVDMSNVIALRNKYKDQFLKKYGVKLGFMSPFVRAAAFALQDQPIVNAVIEGNEIVHRDYVDISIAVATPKGLVVPVVRNVETMNYAGIELAINEVGEKARNGTLAVEDMDGGTFTISNGGVFGSLMGTPIINPPQSAILGMHATNDRPVAINGKVEIRPMMYVALTYDHRLIDGREAVLFLRKIKSAVEDPAVILVDV